MAINRLEVLQSMVEQNPADGFSRYGLAMEMVKTGDLTGAVEQFRTLLQHHPNYAAGYFHGGQTLEKLGRLDEAKELYGKGIEVTATIGDGHTQSELQAALSMLG
jgi:tetratricopeptide (TPR) repeat protein